MSFTNDAFDWNNFNNAPVTPMISETGYHWILPNHGLQLATYADTYALVDSFPTCSMYAMDAYINPDLYTLQSIETTPSETLCSPAAADTPQTQASTPPSSRGSSPSEGSGSSTR